jgi:hypothetical protein
MTTWIGPTRRSVISLLLLLWQMIYLGTRTFTWDSLRHGAIDLRPLNRPLRLLTLCGLALILGFLFSLLFNDLLRLNGRLEPLTIESTATRGLLVPSLAVPLTLIALTLGWGYILTGALHVRPAVRWPTLLIYLLFGLMPLSSSMLTLQTMAGAGLTLIVLLLLVVGFILLPRWPLPLPLEFSLMVGLHGLVVLFSLIFGVQNQLMSDGELRVSSLVSALMDNNIILIAPFLFIAGLGWIDFGLEASGWVAKSVRSRLQDSPGLPGPDRPGERVEGSGPDALAPAWVAILLLGLFLVYRLFGPGRDLVTGQIDGRQWGALAGAAVMGAGLIPMTIWRSRRPAASAQAGAGVVPRRLIVALILLGLLVQIFLLLLIQFASLLPLLNPLGEGVLASYNRFLVSIGRWSDLEPQYRPLLMAAAGLLIAWLAGRRGYIALAGYGLLLAWLRILAWLMGSGRPLYALRFSHAEVEIIVLLALAGLSLFWLARRRLNGERATRLLALAVLMALLNQTDFLDNPFSPFFGFAGVFFLVFGILWNVLTAGGQFANAGSPGFPRASRLLLYLGYVLFSISVTHWYLVSHNLEQQILQSDLNFSGFVTYGLPLAYLALVEGGQRLLAE